MPLWRKSRTAESPGDGDEPNECTRTGKKQRPRIRREREGEGENEGKRTTHGDFGSSQNYPEFIVASVETKLLSKEDRLGSLSVGVRVISGNQVEAHCNSRRPNSYIPFPACPIANMGPVTWPQSSLYRSS